MREVALQTSESHSSDREVLLELNRNYVRSALESDVRWYSENLSEDFYITAPDGALLNREAFLKRIASPYPGTEAEAVDVMIRILGDVAIIHSGYRDKKLSGDIGFFAIRISTNGEMVVGFASPRTSCAFRPLPRRNICGL